LALTTDVLAELMVQVPRPDTRDFFNEISSRSFDMIGRRGTPTARIG
jgi:hypothetical protein